MALWKEIFSDSVKNSAVAASGNEMITSSVVNINKFQNFNSLIVQNTGSTDVEIRLDGVNNTGRVFVIPANSGMGILPDENTWFVSLMNLNLDAVNAQVADTILFRWAKAERIE